MAADDAWLAKYGTRTFGIQTHYEGELTDADGNVTVTDQTLDGGTTIFTGRVATHVGTGIYSVTLGGADTATEGLYKLTASWLMDAVAQSAEIDFQVGEASPDFEALAPDTQAIANQVWWRLADLFDSPYGGPHLQVYQQRFTRNRIAQLMRIAVGTLNTSAQPFTTFSLDPGGKAFPTAQWGPLLERATWIEVLKHLRRSYVEQPVADIGGVSRLDRRDYLERWGAILQDEVDTFEDQMEMFKLSMMGLSAPRVLIAGGAYGITGSSAPLSLPARPHYWLRGLF